MKKSLLTLVSILFLFILNAQTDEVYNYLESLGMDKSVLESYYSTMQILGLNETEIQNIVNQMVEATSVEEMADACLLMFEKMGMDNSTIATMRSTYISAFEGIDFSNANSNTSVVKSSNTNTSNTSAKTGKPTGIAYAVTWQNSAGYWWAVGPTQALWAAEETEAKALDLVRGYSSKKNGEIRYVNNCGKFRVYTLGVDYNSYDKDVIPHVIKNEGYSCNWP